MIKPETKKAAKARLIAEKLAEKERIKAERRAAVFSTPVAIAVEPLRVDAMQEARAEELVKVKWITDKIETVLGQYSDTFDIRTVAPVPDYYTIDRRDPAKKKEYDEACKWESKVSSVVTLLDKEPYKYYPDGEPKPVKIDEEKIANNVMRAQELAALDYEAFVYKLVAKIGEHANAELSPVHGLWTHSFLTVTKADGTVDKWETKRIINRSCLGKLFFQWPTRLMKGGDA